MDSPQMYDSSAQADDKFGAKGAARAAGFLFGEDSVADLSDLNANEISLDLQRLIDDSQFVDTVQSTLFSDLLGPKGGPPRPGPAYMPHPASYGQPIKREPVDPEDFHCQRQRLNALGQQQLQQHSQNSNQQQYGLANSSSLVSGLSGSNSSINSGYSALSPDGYGKALGGGKIKSHKKSVDKGSDEYKRRRERNNIAVRKSREKAKIRSRETEHKVKELQRDNERLNKRIESLTKEVTVLRGIFGNVPGVSQADLQRELANHMGGLHVQ